MNVLLGKAAWPRLVAVLLSVMLVMSLAFITEKPASVYASDPLVSHDTSTEFIDWLSGEKTLYRLVDYDKRTTEFIDIENGYSNNGKFVVPIDIEDNVDCEFYRVVGVSTYTHDGPYTHPAFSGSDWITEVRFEEPSLVTYIGDSSFADSAVNKVLLPKSLQTIGDYVFEDSALTVISLPPSVTSIGDSAFAAPDLAKIVFRGQTPPSLDTGAFDGLRADGIVYYPAGANYGDLIDQLALEAGTGWTAEPYTDLKAVYEYAAEDNDLKKITASVPTISGDVVVGQQLTAIPGAWKPDGITFSYQWYAGGNAVANATKSTYSVVGADAGKKIKVAVTGRKDGYADTTKTSTETSAVVNVFAKTAIPTISGTAKVGNKLTANAGVWSPAATFSYQWYAGGNAIKNANKSTYTIKSTELGKAITVKVTGSKSGYVAKTVTSEATAKVTATFKSAPVPKIKGTAKVGKTLKIKAGAWSPKPKFTYKWYANGKLIKGATKASLKLKKAQKGKKITVKLTATKQYYITVTKTSKPTGKVKK